MLKQFSKRGTFDKESLEIWDIQLVEHGIKIHEKRKNFIGKFIPIFQKYYELISGGREQVSIEYDSHLNENEFSLKLEKAIERDRILEHTTVGIHKDELEFLINGYPLKKYASQGQQKSFLIALKLAQFDFIKNIKNTTPILLLDDIYDRLDDLRIKQLMKLVCSNNFGQLFITDTHPTRLATLFKESEVSFKIFNIANGKATENKDEKSLELQKHE